MQLEKWKPKHLSSGNPNSHETRDTTSNSNTDSRAALSVNEIIEPYYFDDPKVDVKTFLRLFSQYVLSMLSTFFENITLQ